MASPIQIPSGMNDALWPLRTNVVSANAARPRGAGSATGQNAGNSRSVVTAMGATSFVPLLAVAPSAGAFQTGFPSTARLERPDRREEQHDAEDKSDRAD